jgi:hypothetical protein
MVCLAEPVAWAADLTVWLEENSAALAAHLVVRAA